MNNIIRMAEQQEHEKVIAAIGRAGLNTETLQEDQNNYIIMENEAGDIEALVGIKPVGRSGLLRSLVFTPACKQQQIVSFFQSVLAIAAEKHYEKLYLVTHKKDFLPFFEFFGFHRESVDNIQNNQQLLDEIATLQEEHSDTLVMCHEVEPLKTQ